MIHPLVVTVIVVLSSSAQARPLRGRRDWFASAETDALNPSSPPPAFDIVESAVSTASR